MPASALSSAQPCDRSAAVPWVCKNNEEPPTTDNPEVEITSTNGGVHACVLPFVVSLWKIKVALAAFPVVLVSTTVDCQPAPSTTWGTIKLSAERGSSKTRTLRVASIMRFMAQYCAVESG